MHISPTFNAQQLREELLGRSYLLAPEIEVYIKNLIRIVAEQDEKITALQSVVTPLIEATAGVKMIANPWGVL